MKTQCTSIFVTFMEKNRRNISKCTQYSTLTNYTRRYLWSTHLSFCPHTCTHWWEILSIVGRDINGGDYFIAFTNGRYTICCVDDHWFLDLNLFSNLIQDNVVRTRQEINVTCASFVVFIIVTCNFMRKLISIKWSSHKTWKQERDFCRKIPSLFVCA